MNRIEALWFPSLRDARHGETLVARGNVAEARAWFEKALREPDGERQPIRVLDFIVDACRREEAWELTAEYSRRLLKLRDDTANRVRSGEALFALGRCDEAEPIFKAVIASPPAAKASEGDRIAFLLAERDEAYILGSRDKDLTRSVLLAENGIKTAMRDGQTQELLSSLNDTLAWIHLQSAAGAGQTSEIEQARIAAETALDDLTPAASPSVTASVLFHLSQVYSDEGAAAASSKAYRAAKQASAKTVERLVEDRMCGAARPGTGPAGQ